MLKKLAFIDWMIILGTFFLCSAVLQMDTGNPYINFLARIGNIGIFLYLLWRFAGKATINAMSKRRLSISDDLADLEKKKNLATQHLANLEKTLSNIEQRRADILTEANAQAEKIKEAIIQKAKSDAEAIKKQAQKQIESQLAEEKSILLNEFANKLALQLEDMLRGNISPEQHSALIQNALNKVKL